MVSNSAQNHTLPLYLKINFFPPSARLHSDREQESGFYTGRIEAVDIESHKYWVTFDRPGLGKHPVADTEIRVGLRKKEREREIEGKERGRGEREPMHAV